jgi:hypothetical protein
MASERETNDATLASLEHYKNLLKAEKEKCKTWKGKLDLNDIEMVQLRERHSADVKLVKQADYRVVFVEG